ncbi:PH domain-containing protein [Nocardia australiensis]|uniref:PH domain-containing protein n=1 Tax=Nocardia australiensis TaxID=2887191 RepID=UPI001D14699F|nr:PH domain-containing protein [Nocardia australiensis]
MNPENPQFQPPEPRTAWATPISALLAVTGGGMVLACAAILSNDGPSRLLVGLAALGLLFLAVLGFRQRPRLSIIPGPESRLVVRNLTGPATYSRDQILRARVVYYRRLGRKMPMLEIDVRHDGDERLLIFSRWDLGTRPDDVFEALLTHGLAQLPAD